MATSDNDDDGGFRRIITDFGGSSSIQGTEDWPIDPDVDDVKAWAAGLLVGLAGMRLVPDGLALPIPGLAGLVAWIEGHHPLLPLLVPGLSIGIGLAWLATAVVAALLATYLAPEDQAPLAWLSAIARFQRSPKRYTQHSDSDRTSTQNLTRVERMLPISGAVKRRDGALVGLVEIEGRDMALAEPEAWEAAGRGFEGLADTIDGPFEVFSPARTVDPGRIAKGYVGRELDDDVRESDTLAALIDTYQHDLRDELERRGTAVRRFYVVVWVTEGEVRRQDHGVLAKLGDLRLVGGAIRRVGLARREATDAEIETRQKSILSARKRAVSTAVASIEGCEAIECDAEQVAAVLSEYWTGVRTPHEGKPVPNTSLPYVTTGEPDDEDPAETGGY